jgi:GT2 family glycosyltransferase
MKVSVVIPMYNASKIILNCLNALALQEHAPDEVIIVNNNSTDSSRMAVQNAITSLKGLKIILCDEQKAGPAAARNKGAAISTGDIIAFTDTDCIPDRFWVKNILLAFKQDKYLDVIGGIDKSLIQPETVMGKFLSAFWLTSDYLTQAQIHRKEDFFDGKFIITFNCAFKRELFNRINGFDEGFKHGEDLDITLRAVAAGGKVMVWNSKMAVCHRQDICFRGLLKREFYYANGLVHTVHEHFRHNIFIMMPKGHYQWTNRNGLTVVLMTNVPKSVFLLIILSTAAFISLSLFWLMFAMAFIYFFIKIRRLVRKNGANLTLKETLLAFLFYLGREISELIGRIYWSFKYKVLCF